MKTLRSLTLCLVVLLLLVPLLRARDLSKYRHFTLGMNLTKLLERTEQKMTAVKTIHGRPELRATTRSRRRHPVILDGTVSIIQKVPNS
jgi:hypothetical protein